jgi:flagellar biosynthesis protein FlhB
MADAPAGEQTEDPTPKRLADAKRDGDRLQSKELAVAMVMAGGIAFMVFASDWLMQGLRNTLQTGLQIDRAALEEGGLGKHVAALILPLLLPFSLILGATWLAALAGPALLGGLSPSSKALAFKGSRISPIAGMKRIFGVQGLIELVKSLLKVALIGGIGIWFLIDSWAQLIMLAGMATPAAAQHLGAIFAQLMWLMLGGLILIALIDVPLSHAQRQNRLKMTRQQVQDEHKESEGSPERKSAQRAAAHAILSRSTRKGVQEAQVVLVNPSHFAVALRYRPGEDAAPIVVARGSDHRAFAIRDLATGSSVPVLSYPQLTRAIYFTAREGQVIDERLFVAVATLLAFIFRLDAMAAQAMRKGGAASRPVLPSINVPHDLRFAADGSAEAA